MSYRPVEDAIIAREEAQERWAELLSQISTKGRLGKSPTAFALCHMLDQGYTLAQIQADYACDRWSIMWRLRQVTQR